MRSYHASRFVKYLTGWRRVFCRKELETQAKTSTSALVNIEEAGKKMQDFGGKVTDVGKDLSTKVTAPILAIGAAAVKTTADFDSSMSQVKAVSGATGEEFDALRDKAREMPATMSQGCWFLSRSTRCWNASSSNFTPRISA